MESRLRTNFLNFAFVCAFLAASNSLAGSHFTDRINKISDDLSKSLGAALDVQVTNYTSIYENVTYASSTGFNSRGMAVLYNATSRFMDAIAAKDAYPEGLLKVANGRVKLASLEDQWRSILTHYGALLAVVIVLLLFAVLMPVCGFFFCCCRCCGKCGARSKPFDKKGDLCRKICLATLLICVGTLLLFGVVCAFVSNQTLQDNTYELSPNLKNGVKDADAYLMYTGRQVHVLLNVNYKEFEGRLFTTLDECSNIVFEQLERYSNATSLTEVIVIVNGLDDIKRHLKFIKESTTILRTNASQLADGLRLVRKDLLSVLKDCRGIPDCDQLSNEYINKLGTEIDFDKLPDISAELEKLNKVLDTDLKHAILYGENALDSIRNEINTTVSKQLPEIKDTIQRVGVDIVKHGANISSIISTTRESLHRYADKPLDELDKYVKEYTPYRYYIGIGASCILLLVSICISFGLICGICGKRPDAYGDDCCNKGAGSRFLMLGVAVMFLFSIVLAAVAIVYFITGVLAQRIACDSIRNPNSQVIHLIDELVDIKTNVGVNIKVSTILKAVHSNTSVYNAFELKNYFDLEQVGKYMDKFEIREMFDELKKRIKANTDNIELIRPSARKHLQELIQSGIDDINYDKFTDELKRSLTTVDLSLLSGKLDELVVTVNEKYPNRREIASSLMLSSLHLRTYQDNLVVPMTNRSNYLIDSVKTLETNFNSTIIQHLLKELKAAETYLRTNGADAMLQIANDFASGLEKQVNSYLDRTVFHIKNNLGATGPISHALNATLVSTCDKIFLPWNGFWFSILWCLVLFVPAIVLSVKLAGLYQKYESYPGPLVEAEYLYDAYTDRDNIPLSSSRNDKRHRKKKRKRLDGRGAYVSETPNEAGGAREVPSGSARYADMAPKHWEEFPAGGPPHYQRAPTEYERPPPYYYPGTEQQEQQQ